MMDEKQLQEILDRLDDTPIVFLPTTSKAEKYLIYAREDVPALVAEVRRLTEVERKAIEQSEYIQTTGLTEYEMELKDRRIARLRAALDKYANKTWWTNNPNIRMDDSKDIFMDDGNGWEIAEEALEAGGE